MKLEELEKLKEDLENTHGASYWALPKITKWIKEAHPSNEASLAPEEPPKIPHNHKKLLLIDEEAERLIAMLHDWDAGRDSAVWDEAAEFIQDQQAEIKYYKGSRTEMYERNVLLNRELRGEQDANRQNKIAKEEVKKNAGEAWVHWIKWKCPGDRSNREIFIHGYYYGDDKQMVVENITNKPPKAA